METIIALVTIVLGMAIIGSGVCLVFSKKIGQTRLKAVLTGLYLVLATYFIYEGTLTKQVENIGTGNGGDVGIFGQWWPAFVGAAILLIIATQLALYLRYKFNKSK